MRHYRVEYAQKYLGISGPKLRYMIRHGHIESIKQAKSPDNQQKVRFISKAELERVAKLLAENS